MWLWWISKSSLQLFYNREKDLFNSIVDKLDLQMKVWNPSQRDHSATCLTQGIWQVKNHTIYTIVFVLTKYLEMFLGKLRLEFWLYCNFFLPSCSHVSKLAKEKKSSLSLEKIRMQWNKQKKQHFTHTLKVCNHRDTDWLGL